MILCSCLHVFDTSLSISNKTQLEFMSLFLVTPQMLCGQLQAKRGKTKVQSLKQTTCSYARIFTSTSSNKRLDDLKINPSLPRGAILFVLSKGDRLVVRTTEGGQRLSDIAFYSRSQSLLWDSGQAGDRRVQDVKALALSQQLYLPHTLTKMTGT